MLAFEPPHFGQGATFGGAIAAGLSGPRRANSGGVRDFVLGAHLMDGKGEVLKFGGQVMKNVAGYDVSRLLAGSMGTLGLMLELSVKVLPRADAGSHAALRDERDRRDPPAEYLGRPAAAAIGQLLARGRAACCACPARAPRSMRPSVRWAGR